MSPESKSGRRHCYACGGDHYHVAEHTATCQGCGYRDGPHVADPPPFAGGQGRSDDDVVGAGEWLLLVVVGTLLGGATYTLLRAVFGAA